MRLSLIQCGCHAHHRLAFTASEVFSCDVQSLLSVFFEDAEDTHLLDHLFAFLSRPSPLSPAHAGYFRKVVGMLSSRKNSEVDLRS